MPNYLKNTRFYLSGPIESASDVAWRDQPKKVLVEEFGVHLFDPFADPKQQWVPILKEARENRNYDTIIRVSKSFVRKDLNLVDRSDALIAFLPYKVCTTGCVHEIINANNAKKPTLLVTDQEDISYLPLWYFGFIPVNFMFAGWEALFDYLRKVDAGEFKQTNQEKNDRWSYIYGDI